MIYMNYVAVMPPAICIIKWHECHLWNSRSSNHGLAVSDLLELLLIIKVVYPHNHCYSDISHLSPDGLDYLSHMVTLTPSTAGR